MELYLHECLLKYHENIAKSERNNIKGTIVSLRNIIANFCCVEIPNSHESKCSQIFDILLVAI